MIAAEEAVQAALQRRDALIESHELRFLLVNGTGYSVPSSRLSFSIVLTCVIVGLGGTVAS